MAIDSIGGPQAGWFVCKRQPIQRGNKFVAWYGTGAERCEMGSFHLAINYAEFSPFEVSA
jgi:hypothetical protein